MHASDLNAANRALVVQTADGFFRSVASLQANGSNYRLNLNVSNDGTYVNSPLANAPTIGSNIRIYRSDGARFYSEITDPPSIPLATVGTPGLAYGSSGTYMPSPGVIQAHGFLQSPSTNTGRTLSAADDLNAVSLASGLYVAGGAGGYPQNMPFTYPANIWIHNIGNGGSSALGSDVTQIAYPWNTGGGDIQGVGGLPPYWRQGYNSGANWSAWQPFQVANKQGSASNIVSNKVNDVTMTLTLPKAGSWMIMAWARAMMNAWNGGQLYINGTLVDTNAVFGDQQGIAYGIMMGQTALTVGGSTTITINANWSGLSPGPDVGMQAFAYQIA
jgi:hypothetical protein